jgi:hypothetical protein
MPEEVENIITNEVDELLTTEATLRSELAVFQEELAANPTFNKFLQVQAQLNLQNAKAADVWKQVEEKMIENNIKSIKTDKVNLTIVERTSFDIDTDLLPNKYIKKVPNTTLIGSEYKLTGNLVKGTSPKVTRYLTKRFAKEA